MRLSQLIADRSEAASGPDPEILGVTADSRRAGPGFLFAALAGAKTDGARFAAQAVAAGAVAVAAAAGGGSGAGGASREGRASARDGDKSGTAGGRATSGAGGARGASVGEATTTRSVGATTVVRGADDRCGTSASSRVSRSSIRARRSATSIGVSR